MLVECVMVLISGVVKLSRLSLSVIVVVGLLL